MHSARVSMAAYNNRVETAIDLVSQRAAILALIEFSNNGDSVN